MKEGYLSEVIIIRVFLIVLLVFFHAFAIYSGAWTPIDGFPEVKLYWWLDKLSYSFLLEAFVFVSGYTFGYQIRTRGSSYLKIKRVLQSKFKRLIVPCAIFSLLYIIIFLNIKQPILKTIYDLFNGVAHMWFLPMLFWCFIGVCFIENLQLGGKVFLPLILISIFSVIPLPLRLGSSMYYLLFFYIGFYTQKNELNYSQYCTNRNLILSILLFILLFITLTLFSEQLNNAYALRKTVYTKALFLSLSRFFQMICSSSGLIVLLLFVGTKKQILISMSSRLLEISNLCFGVYLFQQFILKWFYYYSPLPQIFSFIWLPWVCFFITLFCSILLSSILNKTKVGHSLIG